MSGTTFLDGKVELIAGDCLEAMAAMPENSVDAIVTDPPYHLTSIVKRFGAADAAPQQAEDATRGQTGAYRRASAGFMGKAWDGGDIAFRVETWAAALRVLKPGGYLLAFASTRGFGRMSVAIEDAGFITHPLIAWVFCSGFPKAARIKAEGYDGFRYGGQALKPAIEPIFMGQKPFSEASGTANILKWGTGGVNVDGCRVAGVEDTARQSGINAGIYGRDDRANIRGGGTGRWPANLIHDGSADVLAAFPEAPGAIRPVGPEYGKKVSVNVFGDYGAREQTVIHGDSGSAARFFYSAKADSDDRIGSKHPTVKPVDLMCYLVRLVTPPGGLVLDPFAGTGTTGEAAFREGMRAVLIEREADYRADIAERMRLCLSGAHERKREIMKRKGMADDHAGPLFAGLAGNDREAAE